jgi:hypothetical protein
MITQKRLKEVLAYNPRTGIFYWRVATGHRSKRGSVAGNLCRGYVRIGIDGKSYKAQSLAWLYMYGVYLAMLDHKNRVKNDNRVCNLRPADKSKNMMNSIKRCDNVSGYRGVSFCQHHQRWRAKITAGEIEKQRYFYTKEEAAMWYASTASHLFGEYARVG